MSSVDDVPFTSGLSIKEFALLSALGAERGDRSPSADAIEPLSQVMGVSVVKLGWQFLPPLPAGEAVPVINPRYASASGAQLSNRYVEPSRSRVREWVWNQELVCELEMVTRAWNDARWQALDDLRVQAAAVGADAVVGVGLERSDHDFGKDVIEFVVTGTAIADPGAAHGSQPVLTDLSVQDYWRLRRGGYRPLGLLACTSVVFASPSRRTRLARMRAPQVNRELEELSRGVTAARADIRRRLRDQVFERGGSGAVGVEIVHSVSEQKLPLGSSINSESQFGWHINRVGVPYYVNGRTDTARRGWVITMHGAGTAIGGRAGHPPPRVGATTVKSWIDLGER